MRSPAVRLRRDALTALAEKMLRETAASDPRSRFHPEYGRGSEGETDRGSGSVEGQEEMR